MFVSRTFLNFSGVPVSPKNSGSFSPIRPTKKQNLANASPKNSWRTKGCHSCSSPMAFLSWKNNQAKNFRRQHHGLLSVQEPTAPQKFSSYPQPAIRNLQFRDSFSLQSALAARSVVFFAGLFSEDVPARQLPA